jgi:hypothetical protein
MSTKPPSPWWNRGPLVVAGSWHPLSGRLRAGNALENDEELFAHEFTEKNFDALKARGVTLYVGQFDRGLAFRDQEPCFALARKACAAMHRRGIRFGVYLANTLYFESARKEDPNCGDMAVITHDGRRVHYGGEQTWRWVACFNSPRWIARMKRLVEIAVRDVKADLLHLDNLGVWPEPDSCHCPHCQAAFKDFLRRRYPTPAAQERRFGFAGLEEFQAPNWYLRFSPPWDLLQVHNPLMQDWIRFRCETVTRYAKTLRDHAKALRADVCVEGNGAGIMGFNRSFTHGADPDRLLRVLDVFWDENPDAKVNPAPVRAGEPPVFAYPFRSANLSRRLRAPMIRHARSARDVACNLAFMGSAGIVNAFGYAEMRDRNRLPVPPDLEAILSWYRKNARLYDGSRPDHRVAVFRNFESLAFDFVGTHRSAAVLEQLLLNRRIGFDILLNRDLDRGSLAGYRLVILPNVKYLSTRARDRLVAWVRAGGALLFTEQTGHYNEEERIRREPAFRALFRGLQDARERREETLVIESDKQHRSVTTGGVIATARFGRGRAAYLPRILFAEPVDAKSDPRYNVHYRGVDSRYWREPENAAEILALVDWLCPAHSPVRLVCGQGVFQQNLRWEDGSRGVSLFNSFPAPAAGLRLAGRLGPRLEAHLPGAARPAALRALAGPLGREAVLPPFRDHLLVRWRG